MGTGEEVSELFRITYDFLMWLSSVSGLSYEAVNVVIWFFLLPLFWAGLVDFILNRHVLKGVVLAVGIVCIALFEFEPMMVGVFNQSVRFLLAFEPIGLGYTSASVWICLLIPMLITLGLCFAAWMTIRRERT